MAPLSKIRDTLPRARELLYNALPKHFSTTIFPTTLLYNSTRLFSNNFLQHSSPTRLYNATLYYYYLHVSTTLLYNALLRHLSASFYKSSPMLLRCNSLLQHFSTLFPSGQPVPTHETHRGPQCVEQMQSTMIRDYCDRTSLRKACNTRYRARSKHSVQITFTNPTCETTSQQSCEANPKGTQKIVFQVHATRNYAQMQYQPQNPHSERCLKNANQTVNATFKHHAKARVECISQRNSHTKSKCHKRDIS